MYYRTSSIMLNTGQKSGNACDIFIAQPDAHKESLAGKLFILIEIESEKSEALKVINFLINNINYNYYQNEKIILRERIESLKVEHIFETALAKTNKDLVDFLSREKLKISPYAFNATVALIHEDNIFFSNVGKNKNLLIYQDKVNENSADKEQNVEHKITEVSENKQRKVKQTNLTKLFTEVTSGRIPSNGYFLLANEALSEYLSNRQLIEIITKLPPAGAATQIKNTLKQINAYVSFLGVIIKNSTIPEKIPAPEEEMDTAHSTSDSISGLNTTEQKTEKILSPSGVVNFREWFKKIAYGISTAANFIFNKGTPHPKRSKWSKAKLLPLKDKVFFKKRRSQYSIQKAGLILKRTASILVRLLAYVGRTIYATLSNKEKMSRMANNIKTLPRRLSGKSKNGISWVKNLDKNHKIILSVVVVIFIILSLNLFFLGAQKEDEQKQQGLAQLTEQIKDNQNEIMSYLLYDNEKSAKTLLEENKGLLNELTEQAGQEEREERYQELFSKHEEQMAEIRKATELKNADMLTDLSDLNSNASPSNLVLSGSYLFSGDTSEKTIYRQSLDNNIIAAITGMNGLIEELRYPVINKEMVYYLNNDNILQLNTDNEGLSNINIELPENKDNIVDMSTFSNYIYLLNTANNQIHKYTKSNNSFVDRTDWLEGEEDISNAAGLAIDGDVYILSQNGKVNKYQRGRRQEDFKLSSIEPSFEKATKIRISPDRPEGYIYILEPVNNRIAVFNKQGDFQMQYQDEGFTDLRDFVLDEQNNKLYILNGTGIYEVEAEHLN